MPINKETIISVFDEKLTLMQWLKTINKALEEAVLTGVEVRQKGNATISFVVTFEDGTELESNEFVLAQGESINGATIRNGHLYLSLTNGDELDAGNLKPVTSFTINESQHLIVNYGDGTSQDLGAIFSGNVNIDGNFTANTIIENMEGYSATPSNNLDTWDKTFHYVGVVKNGNKITFAICIRLKKLSTTTDNNPQIVNFTIPSSVGNKLIPVSVGGYLYLDNRKILAYNTPTSAIEVTALTTRSGTTNVNVQFHLGSLVQDVDYVLRHEITFLLSDNLVGN